MATLKEEILAHKKSVHLLNRAVKNYRANFEELAAYIPGMFHVNNGASLQLEYISTYASKIIDMSADDILGMGLDFFDKHITQETAKSVFPRLKNFYSNGDVHAVQYEFQQFLPTQDMNEQVILVTSSKIDPSGQFLVSSTVPSTELSRYSRLIRKVVDLDVLSDNQFARFQTLVKMEKQILQLIANGWTNKKISELLYLTIKEVDLATKGIWKKLDIKSLKDVASYAKTFDLYVD